ncbi:kinetochore protein Spc24 [Trematomus bernacchii]|uniref:kinetochore protein Spc24 n=1 Tax=Trematomus bernacchii TaxID=40690 RepID=UPI00146BA24F|nr:kinetochore protein Spc24 [Trematomus bernacchii]
MAQSHKFQDLEETGDVLVSFIKSSQPEKLIQVNEEHQALFDKLNKRLVTPILKDMSQVEEAVGQRLMDMEEEKNLMEEELQILEDQLRKSSAKSQMTDSELQFLQRELESLRIDEDELEVLRSEVDEDTTEVIPSAVYVSQLYHVITRIKWEYDTPPNVLKGVHYGPDLATPINLDTCSLSPCEVSDQLWSFVSTEW